jgi:hypothetical protein
MEEAVIKFLIDNYYSLMKALSLVCIVSLLANLREVAGPFKKIESKTFLLLFLIIASGFALRMWFVPHTPHVYFDEFEHMNIAANMAFNGKFFVTLMGTNRLCEAHAFPPWPPGYHSIVARAFSIFGDSESVAYNLTALFGFLSVALIFLMTYLLFNSQKIALCTAFLFNLIPVHLKYSGTMSLEIPSLFFISATYLTALIYVRRATIRTLFLLVSFSVFTFYMRPENGALLFFIPFFIFLFADKDKYDKGKFIRHSLFTLAFLILAVPYFLHMYLGISSSPGQEWNAGLHERLGRFFKQAPGNLFFWFSDFTPLPLTLLAIFGILRLLKENRRILLFFFVWFIVFFLLYSQHHTASFVNNPDGDRFSLPLYLAVVIFAGFGLFEAIGLFKINKIVLFLLFSFLFIETFSPLRISLDRTFSRDVYKEYRFILENKDRISEDMYVITFTPPFIISTIHKKAIAPEIFVKLEDKPEKAILLSDFWWNPDAIRAYDEIKGQLNSAYNFKLINQCPISRYQAYSFILLTKKDNAAGKIKD